MSVTHLLRIRRSPSGGSSFELAASRFNEVDYEGSEVRAGSISVTLNLYGFHSVGVGDLQTMAFPTSSKGVAAKVSGAVPGGAVEDAAVSLSVSHV